MRRLIVVLALAATVILGAGVLGVGTANAAPYPVDYNFFAGIPFELRDPGGSLPGSNDWNCTPTAAHPNPVVLVHGTGGSQQTNWGVYAPLLANEGYCVFALTYGAYALPWPVSAVGGMRPMAESAAQLGDFVRRVLAATGASQVDIVGHSQGTVIPNYYLKRLGGAGTVDRYVSLAPAYTGTNILAAGDIRAFADRLGAGAAFDAVSGLACQACGELLTGTPFLRALNADGVYAPGVRYTNIMTRYDELVVPYTSPAGPDVTNIVVQDGCAQDYSEHAAIAGSPRAAAYVLNALDPAHPRPVPCEIIPPFSG